MSQSILSSLLIIGLLASGNPCGWLCRDAPAAISHDAAVSETPAHCHDDPQPASPSSEEPCQDDCPACGISSTSIPATTLATGASRSFASVVAIPSEPLGAFLQLMLSHALPPPAHRLPPLDILAITTTLQV